MRRADHFYLAELDGLRFFAFLAVFLHHAVRTVPAPPAGSPGWTSLEWWLGGAVMAGAFGVDLFFVLSSFLITALLLREADARGAIDVPAFWMRRLLRIWPLYHAFVLVCWVTEGLPFRLAGAFVVFAGNWALLAWPLPAGSLLGPLWSVSVEEQFYLAWPLVLAALPRRALRPLCLGMVAVAVVARALILAQGGGVERIWLNTLARLDPIAVGALIALARPEQRPVPGPAVRWALGLGGPLAAIAAVGILWQELILPSAAPGPLLVRPGLGPAAAAVGVFTAVALGGGAMVWAAAAARGSWLGHPALVYLGRISYGLYVFHLAGIRAVEALPLPWRCLLGFGITAAIASLSYRLLEAPFLRLKRRFTYVSSAPLGETLGPEGVPRRPVPTPRSLAALSRKIFR